MIGPEPEPEPIAGGGIPQTRREARHARRRRVSGINIVASAVLLVGSSAVLYPSAADWFSDRAHATQVSSYVSDVGSADDTALQQAMDDAHDYNDLIPDGPLRDPFSLNSDGSAQSLEKGRAEYESLLRIGASDAIARVRIPQIDVDLPIYHGTDEEVLDKGVGHLYGSSLPVGGAGTHSVLSGHSGVPSSTLFSDMQHLAVGDRFFVDVAGEVLVYKIDKILTVGPSDGEPLRRVAGRDYVTLLTCTPIGVNTHRLLIRGERVSIDSDDATGAPATSSDADPGAPWWVLGIAGAIAVSVAVAWPRRGVFVLPSPSRIISS